MPIANHGCVPFIGYSVDDKIVFSSSSLTKLDLFSDRHYWIVEFEHASAINNLEKFRSEDGDKIFRETIINTIQEKCNQSCDPDSGKCDKVNPEQEIVANDLILISLGT